ncbi:MAG: MtrB/PioB family outer membrane beta-barrel protein [Opitutales bacterium]
MKLSLPTLSQSLARLAGGLLLAGGSILHGQTPLESANESLDKSAATADFNSGVSEIPVFFEDEFEDLGPQYLLKPGKKPHDWFRAVFDSQWLYTSNPTLASDETAEPTDLFVFTGQFGVSPRTIKWLGGDLSSLTGYRYQIFKYAFATDDKLINGFLVSENNFTAHTLFSDVRWTRDQWVAQVGLRFTRLDNSTDPGGFYNELVPTWALSRSFNISQTTQFSARYDGSLYATKSDAFRLQRDDFNDRISNTVSINLTHQIFKNFFFQPSARVNHSKFTDDPTGDREDLTWGLNGTLSYRFGAHGSIRFFTGYQSRDSNGVGITDYTSLDIGWGANASFRF